MLRALQTSPDFNPAISITGPRECQEPYTSLEETEAWQDEAVQIHRANKYHITQQIGKVIIEQRESAEPI